MTFRYSIDALFDYRDGRLKRSDELLMINGKSLIGLSHSEAVDVLRNSPKLVQLVVASKVSVDQGIQQSEIELCTLSDWDTYHLQTLQYALFFYLRINQNLKIYKNILILKINISLVFHDCIHWKRGPSKTW